MEETPQIIQPSEYSTPNNWPLEGAIVHKTFLGRLVFT